VTTLLIGAGSSRDKRIVHELTPDAEFNDLVTLDITGVADIYHDLNEIPYPFRDKAFTEIHAYEVLEHCGSQGDGEFFFGQFNEFWRILKPGGVFCGSVPHYKGPWAFGDPGHKRILPPSVFGYLTESFYDQLGETFCADYRDLIKGYWKLIGTDEIGDQVVFMLQK